MSNKLKTTVFAEPNNIFEFDSKQKLAAALADDIVTRLQISIQQKGIAIMALSGGSTPLLMLQQLSKKNVDWSKVVVTLVDERCVGQLHSLSNARFLRQNLFDHLPATVKFAPLYFPEASDSEALLAMVLEQYCDMTNSSEDRPANFDVVVLGMGNDGHTASFFPDANNIETLVDIDSRDVLLTCESPSTQVPRITWSLPMLLQADMLALHITGESKKQVLQQAMAGQDKAELPIRSVIFQQLTPLDVYYAD